MRLKFQIDFGLGALGAGGFARQAGFGALHILLFANKGALALQDPETEGLDLAACLVALRDDAPIYDIWVQANKAGHEPATDDGHNDGHDDSHDEIQASGPQEVMLYRDADFTPHVALLPRGGAAFITALQDGAALAHAAQHVAAEALTPLLTQLIQAGLVLGVTDRTKTQEATNVSHT